MRTGLHAKEGGLWSWKSSCLICAQRNSRDWVALRTRNPLYIHSQRELQRTQHSPFAERNRGCASMALQLARTAACQCRESQTRKP